MTHFIPHKNDLIWSIAWLVTLNCSAAEAQTLAPSDQFTRPIVIPPETAPVAEPIRDIRGSVNSRLPADDRHLTYSTIAVPVLEGPASLSLLTAPVHSSSETPRHALEAPPPRRRRSHSSDRQSADKEAQYLRLESQVQQLDKLWRRSHEAVNSAAVPASSESGGEAESAESSSSPDPLPAPAAEAQAGEQSGLSTGDDTPANELTANQSGSLPAIEPVVSGEIDRLGLADSLYATGETSRACEIYRQLPLTTLRPDLQQWVNFQLANCSRRQGDVAEAERQYRQIINTQPDGWLGELCRWWLLHLDDQRRLAANSAKLAELLTTLSRESPELTQQSP
ncbi:MAG: tetratricopeptide repeat protein [Planctomycetaceae bacterium]